MSDHPDGSHPDRLSAFADDVLAPGDRAEVLFHLESCARCRQEVSDLRALKRRLSRLPVRPAPAFLVRRLKGIYAEGAGPPVPRAASTFAKGPWVPLGAAAFAASLAAFFVLRDPAGRAPVPTPEPSPSASLVPAPVSDGVTALAASTVAPSSRFPEWEAPFVPHYAAPADGLVLDGGQLAEFVRPAKKIEDRP